MRLLEWLALICCAVCFTLHAQPASRFTAEDNRIFEQAMAAMNSGNSAQAEPLLKALHVRHPKSYEINESLGLLYASQNKLEEALPLLEAARLEQPSSDVAHANLGTAYLKMGRTADAAHELERAAKLNPSNAATQEALGQAWMLLKEFQKAAAAFRIALPLDSSNPDLLYNFALALFNNEEAAEAEPVLARMPGLESSAEAQSLYGDIEEKLGHYKEAAQHYANAVRLAPTEANLYLLGVEFLRHWTFEPAVKEFEAGVKQFPDSKRIRLALGVAYYGNGNYDQAIPVFAGLLAGDPENSMYAELLGRTCTVLTEGIDPKCGALIQFAEKHPDNAMLATYAATSILHRPSDPNLLQLARRLLEGAVKANPQLPQARYGMGLLLQIETRWQDSIPELEEAVRLKPDYASAHYRLALAYSRVGQRDKAQAEIALQQKYSKAERTGLDARLKQVTTLLVTLQ